MRDNPNMESFYEENAAQLSGQTPTITNGGGTMKRPLTLDLGKDLHPAKRLRFNNNTSVISTPDLQMLKMVSPELEKFIMNGGNPMATPTPGLNNYPQKEVSPVELLSVSQIRNEAGQSPGRMECVPFPFRLSVGLSIIIVCPLHPLAAYQHRYFYIRSSSQVTGSLGLCVLYSTLESFPAGPLVLSATPKQHEPFIRLDNS